MSDRELTNAEMASINFQLNDVIADGPEVAISWLRAAFMTHKAREKQILADMRELTQLFLAATGKRWLTVREAQLCHVCRICHGKVTGPFKLNYGEEYAHEACLDATEPPTIAPDSPKSTQ